MGESVDFKIERGIFKGYIGPGMEVLEIPEGVTAIESFSLRTSTLKGCKKIIFPASLHTVGRYALSVNFGGNCDSLEELEFLGDVKLIESGAFDYIGSYGNGKIGIKKITFHGKVGEIGEQAFNRAKITKLEFPAGVETIGKYAFHNCTQLKKVYAPNLKKIGNNAFFGCKNLEEIHIPETATIGEDAFYECKKLQKDGAAVLNGVLLSLDKGKKIPEGVDTIGKFALEINTEIPLSVRTIQEQRCMVHPVLPEGFLLTDEKLGGKGLMTYLEYYYKLNEEERAALYLFQSGKQFDELLNKYADKNIDILAAKMAELLEVKGKAKHFLRAVEFVMAHKDEIPSDTVQKLYEIGVSKKYKKETPLLLPYLPVSEEKKEIVQDSSDICAPWREIFSEHLMDKVIKPLGLKKLNTIPLADGSGNAPEFLVKCAIAPYADSFEGKPKHISGYMHDFTKVQIIEAADKAAAMLDRAALQKLLGTISLQKVPQGMLPYCRYADSSQIANVLSAMRDWASWNVYGATGRMCIIIARGALMLSDTREAMMYLDKCGCLSSYAELRGTDADSIRDTVLSDFGLGTDGKKIYDLGSKTIEVTLASNLTLNLFDTDAGKVVKSLPKKGSDPELHAAASADLSEMKKNLKKVVKGRNAILLEEFLNGKSKNAVSWKKSYLSNPVLNMVARLLVWSQGNKTFILTADGAADCNGNAYEILDDVNIGAAHPIEMSVEDVKAWQQYICKNNLVQPFEQMWEPARTPESISEDRYNDCQVSVYRFMNNEKHGIHFFDEDFHSSIGFTLEECDLDYERTTWNRHSIEKDETFTLGTFTFKTYSRKVNHLVYLLDKWTVSERVLKDDVSVIDILDGFTVAQITEFIQSATENGCVNVTAALLEYKNRTFTEFDPMDEFSLDL